jgi:hypothetical protein
VARHQRAGDDQEKRSASQQQREAMHTPIHSSLPISNFQLPIN